MKGALNSICFGCALFVLGAPGVAVADIPLTQTISVLSQRLEETPRDAALLTDYGNLLTRAGRYEEALTSYQRALEVDPESLVTLYNLGLLEFELGHDRKAGRHFKKALAIDGDFARGHYALGTVLASRQRHPRAVRHFARAFSLEPDLLQIEHNPEILFNRLATWASVRSYLSGSPQRGTRLYNDPQPIVGLLVPDLERLAPAPEPDPPAGSPSEEPAADEAPPSDDSGS